MSEYWKSTPKYWCKHCSTYVRDTAFERRQHEATARHQNNLKRSLRDIQNNHERGEREKERAKAEVERLNKVVGNGGSTNPTTAASASHTSSKTTNPSLTVADQKRQWSQLAEMGIKVPENFRSEMAMAGDWSIITQYKVGDPTSNSSEPLSVGIRKRKLDEQEKEELEVGAQPTSRRTWGKSLRTYPGKDSNDPDLDALLSASISLKKEKGVKLEDVATANAADNPKADVGQLTDTKDSEAAVPANEGEDGQSPSLVKPESPSIDQSHSKLSSIPDAAPVPLFKKRKNKIAVAT